MCTFRKIVQKPKYENISKLIVILLLSKSLYAESDHKPLESTRPVYCWKVTSKKTTVYLCGCMHSGQKEWYPMPSVIEEAFAKSDTLAVEVDTLHFSKKSYFLLYLYRLFSFAKTNFTSLGILCILLLCFCQKNWLAFLSCLCIYAFLHPMSLACFDVVSKELAAMQAPFWKRWVYYMSFILLPHYTMDYFLRLSPFQAKYGTNAYFLNKAKKLSKNIISLESVNSIFSVSLSTSFLKEKSYTMEQKLNYGLKEAPFTTCFYKLLAAWQKGSTEAVGKFCDETLSRVYDEKSKAYYNKLMNANRNKGMVKKINRILKGRKTVFVLVGAAHFCGKDGILALLQKKGWKVTQLRQPLAM